MRYVNSRYESFCREEIYRIYVTDTLRAIIGGDKRYYDFVKPATQEVEETRSAEEIIGSMKDKLTRLGGG